MSELWHPRSWQDKPAKHIPAFGDQHALSQAEAWLAEAPQLVSPREIDLLADRLAEVAAGRSLVLQAGPCSEALDQPDDVDLLKTVEAIGVGRLTLEYLAGKPVVTIGRLAGQFAKPRSAETEETPHGAVLTYRGDIINGIDATPAAREPDPARMLRGYTRSDAVLGLLRGRLNELFHQPVAALDCLADLAAAEGGAEAFGAYVHVAQALRFVHAIGLKPDHAAHRPLHVSHEALLLNYEWPLVRRDEQTGNLYATSGHLLWIGERTRSPDGAHVEFLRGIANPIGLKCGPKMTPDELLRLIDILNPRNIPGRLTLIVRAGAQAVSANLAALARAVKNEGRHVVWITDPMHGNTESHWSGLKTRRYDAIRTEVEQFGAVLHGLGLQVGGLHLEMTGSDVTECVGGTFGVISEDLPLKYLSSCDPRLNYNQTAELVASFGAWVRRHQGQSNRDLGDRDETQRLVLSGA